MTALRCTRTRQTVPLLIVVCLAGIPARAQYGGGSGTAEDPYQIWTAEQMNAIGAEPNDFFKHFMLMADIDLSDYQEDSFNLIGYYDGPRRMSYSFWGTFEGNGHTISNLTYIIEGPDPRDPDPETLRAYGLFRYLAGDVRNLGIINPTIQPAAECTYWVSHVGALAGYCRRGSITNCYVQGGHISGDATIGGLVGYNSIASISQCHSTCRVMYAAGRAIRPWPTKEVPVAACFGGLLGANGGEILESYATGTVQGLYTVGGLAGAHRSSPGANDPPGMIRECFSTGSVSGSTEVGALVGSVSEDAEIAASYATGYVWGDNAVGGLAGRMVRGGSVVDCYATGGVSGRESVGGLLGEIMGLDSRITNCYAVGWVIGETFVGGLVGEGPLSSPGNEEYVFSSFWDKETTGQTDSVGGGEAKTTAEMQDPNTYMAAQWDFVGESANGTEDIWRMTPDASTYPQLVWEPLSEPFLVFSLDEDPGWTTEGQWQFGKPAGQGGSAHGNPDPNSGYTGDNVYGVNLDGDYSLLDRDPHYLTCGPVDCNEYHHVLLQFARWLNTDQADFVKSAVEVSDDGSTWHTVWEHASAEAGLTDDTWRLVTYDISCWADRRQTVYLRWSYHVMYPEAWEFSGWNLDDVKLLGVR